MKYLFGPVNSRRLGISLGIDLMKHKTCTLNCVYCECGSTTDLKQDIGEYVPYDEVIEEIDNFFMTSPEIDYITFSGSGEPTLHSGLGDIISYIKKNYKKYKVAVLTNGTLLYIKKVRRSLLQADMVVPSFDAQSKNIYDKILRPAEGISPEKHIQGLKDFSLEYRGLLILEIFIVPGINDTIKELTLIKNVCIEINPHEIHINSLDRPGAETWVKSLGNKGLNNIVEFFKPLNARMIGKAAGKVKADSEHSRLVERIISIIKRRPSTLNDLHLSLGIGIYDLNKIIKELLESGLIKEEIHKRGRFFKLSIG